jgi:DNA polymerase IV
VRKIIHLDMDCFYAAVEVRDHPALRGRPVAVAWNGPRGVVLTANYEARAYGVRSAMATRLALRRCPELTLVTPRMEVYREVSGVIREVFRRYTDLLEPLSLDEAYLDVTQPKQGAPSGTLIAKQIKREIKEAADLTASAGVSYNKFLAKLASGMNKPDGLTVILPDQAQTLLEALPVEAVHGIGPATARRLHELNIYTGADLKAQTLEGLRDIFGKAGTHFYGIVRGVDERPVEPDRPYKSISAETTFETDLSDVEQLVTELTPLSKQVEARLEKAGMAARAVVVKLKYRDFRTITRRRTLPYPLTSSTDLCREAGKLLRQLTLETGVRLLGVGVERLVNIADTAPTQAFLFPLSP